jgi:uncharacterized protein YndB with AHSA1/START domain
VEIKDDAPATARGAVDVAAPPEVVWATLTDIDQWARWNPDVKSSSLDGPLAPGTEFRWKAGPGTISSRIQEVDPPRRIAWTGKTFGIEAVHVHRLEPRNGNTRVHSEESWDGLIVRLLTGSMRKTLQKSTESGLQYLKAEAERRVAAKAAGSEQG